MKIAVYAICKNESQFVDRFLKSCEGADYICVLDTGSTDDTYEKLKAASVICDQKSYDPFRFDVARNDSLKLVPKDADMCICLDLDEVMTGDWLNVIRQNAGQGHRLRYWYVWDWEGDKSRTTYWADKIHSRHGFKWNLPVHEMLSYQRGEQTERWVKGFEIHHHADNAKPRSSYLPLLALSAKENPLNDRVAHYYARELMFYERWEEAVSEFDRHLSLKSAVWDHERAASLRFKARCLWALGKQGDALEALKQAVQECPKSRESWVELAQAYRAFGDNTGCAWACRSALAIEKDQALYINEPVAWSDWPQKMLDEATANTV